MKAMVALILAILAYTGWGLVQFFRNLGGEPAYANEIVAQVAAILRRPLTIEEIAAVQQVSAEVVD